LNKQEVYVIKNLNNEGIVSYTWRIKIFDNIGRFLKDILYEDHLNDIYKRHNERKQISNG
jgi:hypothetical protein